MPGQLHRSTWLHILLAAGGLALFCTPQMHGHGAAHEMIEELTTAIIRQPDDPRLRYELAIAYQEHGDWGRAAVLLDRVDEMAPGTFATDLLRGKAQFATGQPAAAKEILDRFLAAHPTDPRAFVLRARVLAAMERTEASLADFRAALKNTPMPEPDLLRETADALAACGKSDEAVQVLAAGITKLGPVPSLVLRAMDLEIGTGRFDDALTRVDAMQKSAPRPEPWMAKRAAVLAQAGRVEEARAAWQALINHLEELPNLERGSHAMSKLAEEARQSLAALNSPSAPKAPTTSDSKPANPRS